MKTEVFDLNSLQDNVSDDGTSIWDKDFLGRKEEAEFVENFLLGSITKRKSNGDVASYVLNIDAKWGSGKTFFLEKIAQQLDGKDFLVARVNAWSSDHGDDPLTAVMAAIEETVKRELGTSQKITDFFKPVLNNFGTLIAKTTIGVSKTAIKRMVGEELNDFFDSDGEPRNTASPSV